MGDDKSEETPRTEVVRDTAELEVEGARWTARVGGKSRSGAALASAPILLVRFECADDAGARPRQAWVVGASLGKLTPLQVEAAFRASEVAEEPWARKPLFPEAGSRSGRDS